MSKMLRGFWLPIVLLTSLLTACGGGGGSDDSVAGGSTGTAVTTGITSGVAVDPYITNAKFEEIGADGLTIQSSTGNSTNTGGFSFSDAIQDGSIIQIDLAAKGMHAGKNFQGVIKRQVFVGDQEPVIVSPLTTLLANGMSPASVINMLSSAGLSGLNESDLYTDPMAALAGKTGNITDSDLVLLQANMAVNTFMVATGDFSYGGPEAVATSSVSFPEIATIVKESLNPVIYQQLTTAIGPDFTVEDMANMAVVICDGAAEQVKSGTPIGSVTIIDNDLANAITIADGFYQMRTGGGMTNPGTGTGGGGTTTPPATGTPDGQAIFAGNTGATCSACHTVGTGTGITELAGDGAKVSGKFANGATHNGNTLTASEITAVASYFDSVGGTTTPTTPPATDPGTGTGGGTTTPPATATPDGQAIFNGDTGNNCYLCHTVGTGTGITELAGDGAKVSGKFANGATHNGNTLTAAEISAVATYFDSVGGTTTPTTPPATDPGTGTGGGTTTPPATGTPDGQAIFNGDTGNNCYLCHTVGTGTGITELAGDGAKVSGKFANGATHNGNTLTSAEITAVASYFDSQGGTTTPGTGTGGGTTTPPATGTPDGQTLVSDNCLGCHNIGQGGIMDLSGKGNTAYANIMSGHNGISMTDLEANAVADYLDTLTPVSDPSTPFVHPYFNNPRSDHRSYVRNNGTSDCVSCHGTDLRGSGSAPSCYTCHGREW